MEFLEVEIMVIKVLRSTKLQVRMLKLCTNPTYSFNATRIDSLDLASKDVIICSDCKVGLQQVRSFVFSVSMFYFSLLSARLGDLLAEVLQNGIYIMCPSTTCNR